MEIEVPDRFILPTTVYDRPFPAEREAELRDSMVSLSAACLKAAAGPEPELREFVKGLFENSHVRSLRLELAERDARIAELEADLRSTTAAAAQLVQDIESLHRVL